MRAAVDRVLRAREDRGDPDGEAAREIDLAHPGMHVDFVAGAIEAGSTDAFADYAAWCRRVLQARHVDPELLTGQFHDLGEILAELLPECAPLITSTLNAGLQASPGPDAQRSEGPVAVVRRVFTQAAIRGDRSAAVQVVTAALGEGTAPIEIYTGIFEPSQFEVGLLWEADQLSVAGEHLATAVTQHAMALVYAECAPITPTRAPIVITGVEGEQHQVAANMVADVLAFDGWDVRFLGTDLPHHDIVREVARVQPSILGISATMLFNTAHAASLVSSVRTEMGDTAPRIIVGGAAFRYAPHLAGEIGADGCGLSLADARALASRLG